jgi:hypothetical protein
MIYLGRANPNFASLRLNYADQSPTSLGGGSSE